MENINKNLKEEKSRRVEVYVGYSNHTWATFFIEIPLSTPEENIEKVTIDKAIDLYHNNPNTVDEVAFIGIYNIPEIDGD